MSISLTSVKHYLKHLTKGDTVPLGEIQPSLPKCPGGVAKKSILSLVHTLGSHSTTRLKDPNFDQGVGYEILGLRLPPRPQSNGLYPQALDSTKELIPHTFYKVSGFGEKNELIYEVWKNQDELCERITSTDAAHHTFVCSKSRPDTLPLLNQACNWESGPAITPANDPSFQSNNSTAFSTQKVAGAIIGGIALIAAVRKLRQEGTANKLQGLGFAVLGIAAIIYPNI